MVVPCAPLKYFCKALTSLLRSYLVFTLFIESPIVWATAWLWFSLCYAIPDVLSYKYDQVLCLENILLGAKRCQAFCSPNKMDLIPTQKLFCLTN